VIDIAVQATAKTIEALNKLSLPGRRRHHDQGFVAVTSIRDEADTIREPRSGARSEQACFGRRCG